MPSRRAGKVHSRPLTAASQAFMKMAAGLDPAQ